MKVVKKRITTNDMGEILTAKEISGYLQISSRRVYELFQMRPEAGGIPNFEVGASKRVKKNDFLDWIDAQKQEKMQRLG